MLKSKIGEKLNREVKVQLDIESQEGRGLEILYSESGLIWFLVHKSKQDVDIVVEYASYDNMAHESRDTVASSLSEDIAFSFLRFRSGSRVEQSYTELTDAFDGLYEKGAFVFAVERQLNSVLQSIRKVQSVGSSSSSSAMSNPGFALLQDVCKICMSQNAIGDMSPQVEAIGKIKDFKEYKKSRGV